MFGLFVIFLEMRLARGTLITSSMLAIEPGVTLAGFGFALFLFSFSEINKIEGHSLKGSKLILQRAETAEAKINQIMAMPGIRGCLARWLAADVLDKK
ncbi:MAG: hypothetical protein PHT60_14790 [Acidiphilium sp.]|nr:hypothetical protein [Acidiphilium sp.]